MPNYEHFQDYENATKRSGDTFNVIEFLTSNELQYDILSGKTTLGLIRPNIDRAVNFSCQSNAEAIAVILDNIMGLDVRVAFEVNLDEIAFEELYQSVYERQIEKQPENIFAMSNKWHEFQNLMTVGPTTVLLLDADNRQAADIWRMQLGHWDIENSDQPGTLRGKFGLTNYNNLLHGSDDSLSALQEVNILANCLARLI